MGKYKHTINDVVNKEVAALQRKAKKSVQRIMALEDPRPENIEMELYYFLAESKKLGG